MGHAAPSARLTLAYAIGVGAGLLGAPAWVAPLLLILALAAPIVASPRPGRLSIPVTVVASGLVAAHATSAASTCPGATDAGPAATVGRFLVSPRSGSAPFVPEDGCPDFTVVWAGADSLELPTAGRPVRLEGRWREGRRRPWLMATTATPVGRADPPGRGAARWAIVRWRDGLLGRITRLYGDEAPLVAALILARREGLDPEVREAFAVTGVAHLLAISGFHVGVVAGFALALLRGAGASRRSASLGAAGIAWGYVGLIGFPDAACRAALILGCVAVARARGRPPSRWGALASAALVLLLLDPSRLAAPGFQLSFAGAAGLVAGSRSLTEAIGRLARTRGIQRIPGGLDGAVAAGVAATLATLPIVAWHFERVSLIGIPMTLLAAPVVTIALPGAIASVALDFLSPPVADFLAGGVSVLIRTLLRLTDTGAALGWASAWVSRPSVVAGMSGLLVARAWSRHPRIGASGRRLLVGLCAAVGVVGWPLVRGLEGRGSLEVWMIDVGQGDAIALRTPRGRWILIDTGPPGRGDPRAHPLVRALRGRGIGRIELLVITHADADHHGGAMALLDHVSVRAVMDPALPVAKRGYLDVTRRAEELGIPWTAARAGQVTVVDGVRLRTLHPDESAIAIERARSPALVEANAASVVLLVEWNDFQLLLTGDAYVDVERAIADDVGDVDVLKVGHHGSRTSTDSLFLAIAKPEIALLSVGRRNRYGHPAPEVLDRLRAAGADVHRTDLEGGVRLLVDGRGRVRVMAER